MSNNLNRFLAVTSLVTLFLVSSNAQEKRWVQFSGMVLDFYDSPIEFAHITIKNRRIGTVADTRGLFSIATTAGDTIVFTCVGYKRLIFVFPDSIITTYFTSDVLLETDTVNLNTVNVYPWKNYQEFKQALITFKLPYDRDIENAKRNTAYMISQIYLDDTPLPNASFRQVMAQRYSKDMVRNELIPRNALLDPIAWAKFIKAINNGEYSNKKKKKQNGYK